ncbi:MAG: glycosyltransferase [Candidatus Daviesbacteria bacterium]|nr:glycosyltransferase [Candidatus Daviesbacteria bacterium]
MRIVYFTDMFLPQANGVATSLGNFARELGERGHEVLIFTPKLDHIKRKKFQAKNVRVVSLPSVPSFYTELNLVIFGLPKALTYLRKFDPDIIHLQSTMTIGIDAVMAAKLLKKPLVGSIHIYFTNSDFLRFFKYKLAIKLLNKIALRYINFLYKKCDLLLTPSQLLIGELQQRKFKKEVHYLPNGLYLNDVKFLTEAEKSRLKKKYRLEDQVVLHFGRLSYEKSIEDLIKSFQILVEKYPHTSLLIIGDGPAKKSLMKLTHHLGIGKNVVFTGFIAHQKLLSSSLLSIADIFATTSQMEVNPMVVLEAMMYGLPIVGVKQAGLIELVLENGFLVEPNNTKQLAESMEKILSDPKLKKEMGQRSLKKIKDYSIDKTTTQLINYYRDIIVKK